MYQRVVWPCLALGCLLLLSACAGAAATQFPIDAPFGAASPRQPMAVNSAPRTLTVFAAASLTEAFTELGQQFEASQPAVKVVFNFAGSQQVRAQLEQGAPADVFASASMKEMHSAIAGSLVVSGTQQTLTRNRLVVICPKDNPGRIQALADLARPGLKLNIADEAVPVGQYTLEMLDKMSRDPAFGPAFRAKALANVVSRENNVKAIVSKVRLGEVDAGVVYSTDVTGDAARSIAALPIPDQFNQMVVYPIAPLIKASQPDLARQFIELALSQAGQQVLARYGFIPIGEE